MGGSGRAMLLEHAAPAASAPLRLVERDPAAPGPGCSCCASRPAASAAPTFNCAKAISRCTRVPIVPGHQIVGRVEAVGAAVEGWRAGDRAGVAWLAGADGTCDKCRSGRENLCARATFTGWDVDGGYATHATVRADFALRLPDGFDDLAAAPLLCGGVIGYRSLKRSGIQPGGRLGLYGFGASALIALQIARHWGCRDLRRDALAGRAGAGAGAGRGVGGRLRRSAARAARRGDHLRAVRRRRPRRAARRRPRRDRRDQRDSPRSLARDALRRALVGAPAGERRELHPRGRDRIPRAGRAHPGADVVRDAPARRRERRARPPRRAARSAAPPCSFP